jgi:uncharacterized membrane protein
MVTTFDTQLKNVAFLYARLINARITKTSLYSDLEESPFYPSILSLSKTFSKYDIPNKSFKVSTGDFDRLSAPFLALLKKDISNNDFVLVTKISDNSISYIYDKKKTKIVSREKFFRDFKEVVWVAEPGAQSGETDFEKKLQQEKFLRYKKYGLFFIAISILLIAIFANAPHDSLPVFFMILLLKITGCFIGCILLLYELDENNAIIQSICTGGNDKKKNCGSVLNSNASRIFGISLGEICFFYFASTSLILLFPGFSLHLKLFLLAAGNICTVPFILFSLYYQLRIVKQWCKLCLATVSVLLIELICFLMFFWQKMHPQPITVSDVCVLACCIVLPVISWYALKPVFIKALEYSTYYAAFKRLDNDPDIFNLQLHKQERIYPGYENLGLVIGNPKGTIDIVLVSDLFCNPCGRAHVLLHDLVQKNKNMQLRIIFTNENTETNKGGNIVKHLMAIADTGGDIIHALGDWYLNRDPAEIVTKYPVQEADTERQAVPSTEMHAWYIAADIKFTPAIFINGYALPGNHSPEDLKNIM